MKDRSPYGSPDSFGLRVRACLATLQGDGAGKAEEALVGLLSLDRLLF